MSTRGFSLAEILIAISLMGLVVLAVASVDITSRRFFGTAKDETWIQDEAKIAMQHLVKNLQQGGGDQTFLGTTGAQDTDHTNGFFLLDSSNNILNQGFRIQVRLDRNQDGKYDDSNPFVEYLYQPANRRIRFYPNANDTGTYEDLAAGIVQSVLFKVADLANPEEDLNQVIVTLTVRRDPTQGASLDNPETVLTSSIILKAMSTR